MRRMEVKGGEGKPRAGGDVFFNLEAKDTHEIMHRQTNSRGGVVGGVGGGIRGHSHLRSFEFGLRLHYFDVHPLTLCMF